jgi:hypothetical protein
VTSRERTEYLLETFIDARDVATKGDGIRGGGDHLPMMSELWRTGSYAKLETLMRDRMRSERPKQFRHVSWRYLEASDKVIEVRVQKRNRDIIPVLPSYTVARGKPAIIPGSTARIAVRQYRPEVRLEVVRRGVDWLTVELDKIGGAWLPQLLAAA